MHGRAVSGANDQPFCKQNKGIRTRKHEILAVFVLYCGITLKIKRFGLFHGFWIVRLYISSCRGKGFYYGNGRGLPHVVGLRLKAKPPERKSTACKIPSESFFNLVCDDFLLISIHSFRRT